MSVKGKKHLSMMFALCKTIAESAEHLRTVGRMHGENLGQKCNK